MIRAIIIDDERSGINALQLLIDKHIEGVKIVAATTKAQEGIALIEDYRPEIVFLDISMPDLTGFALLEQLTYRNFNLVFTTAHQEYAIQAIRHQAFDYLLKPIDIAELKNCIRKIMANGVDREKVAAQGKSSFSNTIGLSVKDGIIFIRNSDIIRLEASGSYTVFYLENKVRQMASKSLKEYEAQLDPSVFYRCHNSHLVNLKKVTKFVSHDGLFAQMIDGSAAEIARKNKEQFLERLKNIG
jgi:two-component system LytT family response regulator